MRCFHFFMGVMLCLAPGLAFSDPGGCETKPYTSTETASHTYKGVNCDMTLTLYTNSRCETHATSFTTKLTGNGLNHEVTCTKLSHLFADVGIRYSCKWNRKNGGTNTQQFDLMALGKREWTCQHITDWVLATP